MLAIAQAQRKALSWMHTRNCGLWNAFRSCRSVRGKKGKHSPSSKGSVSSSEGGEVDLDLEPDRDERVKRWLAESSISFSDRSKPKTFRDQENRELNQPKLLPLFKLDDTKIEETTIHFYHPDFVDWSHIQSADNALPREKSGEGTFFEVLGETTTSVTKLLFGPAL